MSEERDLTTEETDVEQQDDVEAHKKHGKDADPIAGDELDDVEAHVKAGKDR